MECAEIGIRDITWYSLSRYIFSRRTKGSPRTAVGESHHGFQLLCGASGFNLLCISDDIGQSDAFHPIYALVVHVTHRIPIRVFQSLNEESAIGVTDKQSPDRTSLQQDNINSKGMSSRFQQCVSIFSELSGRGVWKLSFGPGLRIDCNVEQHLSVAAIEILQCYYGKFGDDGEGDDSSGLSTNSEFFNLDIFAEKVRAAIQAAGSKGDNFLRIEGDAENKVQVSLMSEVF